MRLNFAAAVYIAALSTLCLAQSQQLTNQSIMKMHDAGMSDALIITTVNAQAGTYSTSIDDLISLKKAGISDPIISAMVIKGSASSQLPPPSPTVNASEPTSLSSGMPAKPRVFLTSVSHGPNRNAARDQSMEMSKDVERDCPSLRITLNQQMADYTVSLNHIEVGLIVRDNQFQVADKNGDLIGKTKEGGSIANGVKKACAVVEANWDLTHPSVPSAPTGAPLATP